jgi:hypothetical protein
MLAQLPEPSAGVLPAASQPLITNVDEVTGDEDRVSTEHQGPKGVKRRWEQEDSDLEIECKF